MDKDQSAQLQNRLRELRTARGWTQQALAERVDVSRQTIIAIEKGQYNPTTVLALKLARVLERPFSDIFWLTDELS
ncbi:MAG: helix-turn-helix transcriptional regulator [Ardenticatenaceae bacterium]|nr:helix-turn-helix transcriptional regulator [Ardenticatenaceae bacterium]